MKNIEPGELSKTWVLPSMAWTGYIPLHREKCTWSKINPSAEPIKAGIEVCVPVTSMSMGVLHHWLWWDRVRTRMLTHKKASLFYLLVPHASHFTNYIDVHKGDWEGGEGLSLAWGPAGPYLARGRWGGKEGIFLELCMTWILWFIRVVSVHCKTSFSVVAGKVIAPLEVKIVVFSL